MEKLNESLFSAVPQDDLRPDYANRDPLRNVRPGSPRSHSRFPVTPTLGQGALAVQNLAPVAFNEDPLHDAGVEEAAFFRTSLADIVGEDVLKQ